MDKVLDELKYIAASCRMKLYLTNIELITGQRPTEREQEIINRFTEAFVEPIRKSAEKAITLQTS